MHANDPGPVVAILFAVIRPPRYLLTKNVVREYNKAVLRPNIRSAIKYRDFQVIRIGAAARWLVAFPSQRFDAARRRQLDEIRITDITKTYGKHIAVSDLSLTVPDGALYGFIGPNGSGKTTTIRMILRIIQPDRGEINVFGAPSSQAANDALGYLPEERGLYKKMSVRRMLGYYASLKGVSRTDARQAIDHWLERFELASWGSRKIEALSKGMSQKVQFIASVVARPRLLILDEPFTGLDPVNTEVVRSAILDLQKQGTTIIFSTHDMSVAEKMCDFVFMIYRGKKVLDGTLQAVKSDYGVDSVRLRVEGGGRSSTRDSRG